MKNSEIINKILFDYEEISSKELRDYCEGLTPKMLRWLGANHPDNKTRKIFFELTSIEIGEGTVINRNFIVSDDYKPLLKIGKRVAISPNITIICCSAPNNSLLNENFYVKNNLICSKEVIICDDCWLGANSVVLPGVKIGASSIIGAGAIVTKDVEEFSVYSGVPARKIRSLKL